ncbi:hypothetical protein SAMN05421747_109131 [Parapedobacter composti]|uniref:N-formylglutamate amidohydrolase n=1 Tax=Parapedobacter composti TaxID=623281 RepID=A0A1I1IL16_9SPHI|nr:hypothetical protein [Parapedobacter composti]SFC36885.1 hypothetical protein SAMN05421747_109131 [Parapedobacter composti]
MKRTIPIVLLFSFLGLSACEKTGGRPDATPEEVLGVVEYDGNWYEAGDTIFGFKDYVYLIVGDQDSPLLLGVPHDGTATGNPEIPETGTTGRDLYTLPFTIAIADLFTEDTGKQPWIMVNTIHRKRVDPNTYPDEAPGRYTHPDAMATYESYHELLLLARTTLAEAQEGGKGALYVDMHGHAHRYHNGHTEPYVSVTTGNTLHDNFICQTEVGYGLSNYSLEQPDSYLDGLADSSSIAYLADRHPAVPFSSLIRGQQSFGGLLEAEAVTAVPGPAIPMLDRNVTLFGGTTAKPARRPYFNGGYCTRKYGTIKTGSTTGFDDNVIAIQLETPGINVRNNATIRQRSSHQFKRAIINYLNAWLGYNFPNSAYPY